MSGPTTPTDRETRSVQVFRRRTTVVSACVLMAVVVVVAVLLTPGEYGHGFFPFISALAGALPLVIFALIAGVWPHVRVASSGVTVHNSFVAYDVPYAAIDEIRQSRMGLVIYTTDDKTVAVTAFSSGAAGERLGHPEQATLVVNAIDNAKEFAEPDTSAKITRHLERANLTAAALSIATAVAVIYAAANTYH